MGNILLWKVRKLPKKQKMITEPLFDNRVSLKTSCVWSLITLTNNHPALSNLVQISDDLHFNLLSFFNFFCDGKQGREWG